MRVNQRVAQIVVGRRIIGAQPQGVPVFSEGLGRAPRLVEDRRQVFMRLRRVGHQPGGRLQGGKRVREAT